MKNSKKVYSKNRTLIGLICAILAILVVFALNPVFSKAFAARTTIVRVKSDINEGTKIEKSMLEIVEVGKYGLPENIITDIELVIGQYAATDLVADSYILPDNIIPQLTTAELMFGRLDGTRSAMSLTISNFANGLSGKLQGGDIISIIVTESDSKESRIPEELKYVQVVSATTATGIDTDDHKNLADEEEKLPTTITVLVSDVQAELLAEYNNKNGLHFTLVCRRDNKLAEEFLKAQDEVLGITTTIISPDEEETKTDNSSNDENKDNEDKTDKTDKE